MTPQEEKIRVNARIPKYLYDFVCSEYDNVSQAINEGLEKLRESKTKDMSYTTTNDIQGSHTNAESVIQEHTDVIQDDIQVLTVESEEQKARIEEYKAQVQTFNSEITRLKNVLMEAPNPVDLVRLQERNEGLNLVIAEKEKRIEDLTREVTTLNGFAHYFKTAEVKQIEAPAAEKKSILSRLKFW